MTYMKKKPAGIPSFLLLAFLGRIKIMQKDICTLMIFMEK